MLKHTAVACLLFCGCALQASAQGYYTTANAITPGTLFQPSINLEYRFEPGAVLFGAFGGWHTYSIDSNLKLVDHGGILVNVQAGFSIVQAGDVLDASHINSVASLDGYQLILNQPFLIGMDMINVGPAGIVERFGWARLQYTAAGLQILDQATALGGNGIIAGTTTVLPEPCTLSLITAGAIGLSFARRLKSRRENGPPVG